MKNDIWLDSLTKEFNRIDRPVYCRSTKTLVGDDTIYEGTDLIDLLLKLDGFIIRDDGCYLSPVLERGDVSECKCAMPYKPNKYCYMSKELVLRVVVKVYPASDISPKVVQNNLFTIFDAASRGYIKVDSPLSKKKTAGEVLKILQELPPSMLEKDFDECMDWFDRSFKGLKL